MSPDRAEEIVRLAKEKSKNGPLRGFAWHEHISDFMKWGRSGDCEYPFISEQNAADQAKFIYESNEHKDDFIFILKVFPNGQMVQYSYEG